MMLVLYIMWSVPQPSALPDLLKLPPEPPRDDLRPRPERHSRARHQRVESKPLPRAILLAGDRFGCNSHTSFRQARA